MTVRMTSDSRALVLVPIAVVRMLAVAASIVAAVAFVREKGAASPARTEAAQANASSAVAPRRAAPPSAALPIAAPPIAELVIVAKLNCTVEDDGHFGILGVIQRVEVGRVSGDSMLLLNFESWPSWLAPLDLRSCRNNLILPKLVVLGFRRGDDASAIARWIASDDEPWHLVSIGYAPMPRVEQTFRN